MEAKERTLKKSLASYIILCFFAAWNVFFYVPTDIYIANANEIEIPIKLLAGWLGIVTAAVFAVLLLGCVFIKGKANRIFRAAIFGVSVAFYIQGNFLAAKMGELNGERYALTFGRAALSAAVWLAVLVGVLVLQGKLPEEFDWLAERVSVALFIVQIAALGISAYNNIPKYTFDEIYDCFNVRSISYCSTKNLDLYSNSKNVIIIIADEYDSYLFDEALKEAPETVSEFDGFTYYINTVGKYRLTDISVAYFTSGDAGAGRYTDLTFYKTAAANFKANFYSTTRIPPASVTENYCDNVGTMRLTFGESAEYTKDVYRMAFFRCMPEPLKTLFWFDGQRIGNDLDKTLEKKAHTALGASFYDDENLAFYNSLPWDLTTTDEDVFKLIYFQGVHSIRLVTRDLEYVPNKLYELPPEEAAVATNKILNEYLRILKQNGVYDNSEIVIMGDHGLTGHLDKKYPLLMYKPANQTTTGITVSKAPISYDEIFPTFKMLVGAEPGGRTIFDIAEDEQRVRYFGEENLEITETNKPRDDN